MTGVPVIALDGPAASGKTTVGQMVARQLGFLCLDTGIIYRALTWRALREGLAIDDADALARLAEELPIVIRPASVADGRQEDVLVGGRDVSLAVRSPVVDASVSAVSAHRAVRTALVDVQRRVARPPGTVVVGRDIGTVIFPDAMLKVFLVADPRERARRRLVQRGIVDPARLEAEMQAVLHRDDLDASRAAAPLTKAADAVEIDTTTMTPDEVVERILALFHERERQVSHE
ncbi:MAG: (d)CMP kinase [Chloroflexi bacterium]|nr:(d)CMP kinase [Chloroflexota bacterium]